MTNQPRLNKLMQDKPIIMGILWSLLVAFLLWNFIQGFDSPKVNYWRQDKIDEWIDNIVSSSNYLSSIDSTEAYEIGSCVRAKINASFSLDEIKELEKTNIDSLKIILAPFVLDCLK